MGSQQGGASVHVVLRFKHVHHLVGVELEHALHLHVLGVLFLSAIFCVLLLLLVSPLTFPYSPQISVSKNRCYKFILKVILIGRNWTLPGTEASSIATACNV